MHIEARDFLTFVASMLPQYFKGVRVLDVGSGDINGNNKFLFDATSIYRGNDVAPGKNVDIVSKTSKLPFKNPIFDTIISSECFEHDPEYIQSFRKIISILKPGGLFVFTCASTGRAEHGTLRTSPRASLATRAKVAQWQTYYKNLTIENVQEAFDINTHFCTWQSYFHTTHGDLFFVGIKRSDSSFQIPLLSPYMKENVIETTQEITAKKIDAGAAPNVLQTE